MMQTIRVV